MTGPFESEAEVRALPEVQAIYAAMHASTRRGVGDERCHRLLCDALSAAGVELGAYDHRILAWLAGWEPQTAAVIAGWIQRAHAAETQTAAQARHVVALDLSSADAYFVITEALEDFAARERAQADDGDNPESRLRWAAVADALTARVEAPAAGAPGLTGDESRIILAALADASEGIRERAAVCPACRAHPASLCDECAGRLDQASEYDILARHLGQVTP